MIRAFLFIFVIAGVGGWLETRRQDGWFQRVDELFLDFLVANAREHFASEVVTAPEDSQVVFVRMNSAEKAEYAGWPPRPLDWQMVFKSLRDFEPSVVVIPETLMWGRPSPEFVREAADALLPVPSIVLGVEAQLASGEAGPAFLGGLGELLPRFQNVHGQRGPLLRLGALVAAPDDLLRRQAELGIALVRRQEGRSKIPYAVLEGESLIPGVIAQTLARYTHTPYAAHRLTLGPGAGAYLSEGMFVPLLSSGEFDVPPAPALSEINALDLMNDTLVGALGSNEKRRLGSGKIIVVGTDDPVSGGVARSHAAALTSILAMPRLQLLPVAIQRAVWVVAGLMGIWLVFWGARQSALSVGALLVFAALVVCFLVFQSSLIWCPPTTPVALIVTSSLFARVYGRKRKTAPDEDKKLDISPAEMPGNDS